MTDVGDIDHMPHGVAVKREHASKHVLEHVSTQIADVCMVVHRGAAAVHTHVSGLYRSERAYCARPGVVQGERHRISVWLATVKTKRPPVLQRVAMEDLDVMVSTR